MFSSTLALTWRVHFKPVAYTHLHVECCSEDVKPKVLLCITSVFARSNTAIVGSNPTEAWMFVCVFSVST
jgi:hypothetical protein